MIVIDDREHGMLDTIRSRGDDVPVEQSRLEFGDCMFEGNGEHGRCLVGVERKKLQDLINSMRDRRLSGHQLRGMRLTYEYVFLVAEGVWRRGISGEIEELWGREWRTFYSAGGRTPIMYRQLASYLTTLELRGGVIVRRTERPTDTAGLYVDLWHWFNDKLWHEHTSHDQRYCPEPQRRGSKAVIQRAVTRCEAMAAQIPGIDSKAQAVASFFGSTKAMANATLEDWIKIPGIGKKTAQSAMSALTESI